MKLAPVPVRASRTDNLAQEARNDRVPEFHVAGMRLCCVNRGLGQLDLRHDVLLKGSDFQEPEEPSEGEPGRFASRTGI
jgi:hypothetical protein